MAKVRHITGSKIMAPTSPSRGTEVWYFKSVTGTNQMGSRFGYSQEHCLFLRQHRFHWKLARHCMRLCVVVYGCVRPIYSIWHPWQPDIPLHDPGLIGWPPRPHALPPNGKAKGLRLQCKTFSVLMMRNAILAKTLKLRYFWLNFRLIWKHEMWAANKYFVSTLLSSLITA